MTRIFLIRHAESEGNRRQIFQGQSEEPLSERGRQQAALLGLRFRNIPLDAVYSSPLSRAAETAEAVAQYHKNVRVQSHTGLLEIDVGEMTGQPLSALPEKYPELAGYWNDEPEKAFYPGGEHMEQVFARAKRTLHAVLAENAGKSIAVVSHGALLRCMICALLYGESGALCRVKIGTNTAVSEFLVSESGVQTVCLGDISHLPETLRGDPNQYVLRIEKK